ncbi:MAG: hypothetical protein HY674_00630 [Chloroflexi bacterium]|nr:hypothetical protein [Chloroflexota bacterium]
MSAAPDRNLLCNVSAMPFRNVNLAMELANQRLDTHGHEIAEPLPGRLDFHQASTHLKQKGSGYYLILLRNEIRHRSLREKPAILS